MDDITKIKLERFNECRKNLLVTLNIINIFALAVFFTVFIPYTTYTRNLLSIRIRKSLELIQLEANSSNKKAMIFALYLLLQKKLYRLGSLLRQDYKENIDASLIQWPWLQIYLSQILLYFCLIISVANLYVPANNMPFRLGKIITQENSYQIHKDLDLFIIRFSIIVAVGAPMFFRFLNYFSDF